MLLAVFWTTFQEIVGVFSTILCPLEMELAPCRCRGTLKVRLCLACRSGSKGMAFGQGGLDGGRHWSPKASGWPTLSARGPWDGLANLVRSGSTETVSPPTSAVGGIGRTSKSGDSVLSSCPRDLGTPEAHGGQAWNEADGNQASAGAKVQIPSRGVCLCQSFLLTAFADDEVCESSLDNAQSLVGANDTQPSRC